MVLQYTFSSSTSHVRWHSELQLLHIVGKEPRQFGRYAQALLPFLKELWQRYHLSVEMHGHGAHLLLRDAEPLQGVYV